LTSVITPATASTSLTTISLTLAEKAEFLVMDGPSPPQEASSMAKPSLTSSSRFHLYYLRFNE
jgi:hypothetical protein